MAEFTPILCIDFDGVIHRYSKGWQEGAIYDNVTDGFFDWAARAKQYFKLVIYSSRSKTPEGVENMKHWLRDQLRRREPEGIGFEDFEFAHEKPAAFLTIDDRAVCFEGKWDGIDMDPSVLRLFKPWTVK